MVMVSRPLEYFGHRFITRKAVAAFIEFFSNKIFVERYDENGAIQAVVQPPIQYSNRSRVFDIYRAVNDNKFSNANVTVNNILPRVSIFVTSMAYAGERKLNKYKKVRGVEATDDTLPRTITPVPYKLDVEVSVLTKSIDDMFQIIEQIVPFFTPQFPFELRLIDNFDAEPVVYTLNSVTPSGEDEYGAMDPRIFETILSFSVDINYYYIKRDGKLIRDIILNFYNKEPDGSAIKFQSYELTENSLSTTVETAIEDLDIETTITDY